MKKLHPTQKKIITLLKKNITDPLTIRELQEELNISSPSVVFHHITQLEKKGYLKRNPSNPQDYQIITDSPDKKIAFLNLYGLAQCGPKGSIFDGNPIDRIPISTKLLSVPSTQAYLVKAKGDSMAPKITNGDLIIVKKTMTCKNNDIIVCNNNGEILIKKIIKKNEEVILSSINSKFQPFNADKNFRVEGIVKGILSYT